MTTEIAYDQRMSSNKIENARKSLENGDYWNVFWQLEPLLIGRLPPLDQALYQLEADGIKKQARKLLVQKEMERGKKALDDGDYETTIGAIRIVETKGGDEVSSVKDELAILKFNAYKMRIPDYFDGARQKITEATSSPGEFGYRLNHAFSSIAMAISDMRQVDMEFPREVDDKINKLWEYRNHQGHVTSFWKEDTEKVVEELELIEKLFETYN